MDWISDYLTDTPLSKLQYTDKATGQRTLTPTDKHTNLQTTDKPVVRTDYKHAYKQTDSKSTQTVVYKRNRACQVYTAKRKPDLSASEQLMIMQGLVVSI